MVLPAETPLTMPEPEMDAIDGSSLFHVPYDAVSISVINDPI